MTKYKSRFEQDVAEYYGSLVTYEKDKIHFEQPAVQRVYHPDFTIAPNVYIETKGKFTLEDRKKHLWIKQQYPDVVIIFLFMNSRNTLTRRSKTTYAEWAEANHFPWFCWKTKMPPKSLKELQRQVQQ